MRRMTWMTVGIVVGAGGSVWVRRRVEEASKRMQPAQLATSAATLAGARARVAGEKLRAVVLGARPEIRDPRAKPPASLRRTPERISRSAS
jgi:hypothetical protein